MVTTSSASSARRVLTKTAGPQVRGLHVMMSVHDAKLVGAGITMPSSTAQAALIRATYARAGLDLRRERDRPQYFEAHGTGTQAGDRKSCTPLEADGCRR